MTLLGYVTWRDWDWAQVCGIQNLAIYKVDCALESAAEFQVNKWINKWINTIWLLPDPNQNHQLDNWAPVFLIYKKGSVASLWLDRLQIPFVA